jgi:hypothetical protein
MIMNQNVEVEHHHEELEDILEDKIPVPAWVVAKMETATQNLSDITHYLDGQKEIMEDQLEGDDNDDDDDDEMKMEEVENKEVVEPIFVTAGTKTDLTKKFTQDAFGNLKGFLKGMEGIDLREDYTFDYKDEQYEIEPIVNSDENGVSNAVFTIFDGDGEEVGEVTYNSEGGKQKFTANSEFFSWNNAKFEDGGYFDGTIPSVSSYMSTYADGGKIEQTQYVLFKTEKDLKKITDVLNEYDGYANESDRIRNRNKLYHNVDGKIMILFSNFSVDEILDLSRRYGAEVEKFSKENHDNYAKGGEIAKAEILGLSKNILGTTSIEMKISGMRKPQEFTVYPISSDDTDKIITIQSDTRIGRIDLKSGRGVMSQSHSSGAYFVHLQMDKLIPFTLTESDLEDLKAHIFKTAGSNVGSSVVKSDNSGASRIFAKGGQIPNWLFIGVYPNAYIFADKRIDKNGYYYEIGRIVFNPFQIRIFDNSSKYASAIEIINKEAKKLEKQGYVEVSSTGQTVDIKKMSNGGGFMADVYADGGSVKKDWWQTVVNPNEDFHNYDNRKPIDWEVDDFKEWVVSNSDLDGNVDKEVLDVIKMPKSKLTVDYLNENGSGKNNDEYYKEFGNWQSALYDIFTQMKKDYLEGKSSSKKPKYILKADIKTVTVKRNGKEITYKGADVLNGANVLAKGGDLTSKANYIPKRDVVEVELKDGSKVKPVNGYWVKKGAEPVGVESTPTSSGKSGSKISETYIRKDMRGNWKAETTVDDFNGYDWRISTIKTYSGKVISSAQGGKTEATGSKGIQMFKYTMYEDPNYTLEVSQPSRLTEKVVTEQHNKALAKFKKFMETGTFGKGGKISKFDKLSAKVAKQYEGKPVKSEYQKEYGKYYSKEEAQEVGDKVAGKVKAMQSAKKEMGGETKKMSNAREMLIEANQLAKKIRKDGESWNDAKKRAFAQLKK